jgi:hypothetical protein
MDITSFNVAYFSNYYGLSFLHYHRHVLNWSCELWLFNDVLHFTISLSLKPKADNELLPYLESLMEYEFGLANELVLLAFNVEN